MTQQKIILDWVQIVFAIQLIYVTFMQSQRPIWYSLFVGLSFVVALYLRQLHLEKNGS